MKIGIMGGTFDPIHNGHLMLGEYAHKLYRLDEIWYMPNGNPPHKTKASIGTAAKIRAEMVALALQDKPYSKLELYEVESEETCYSYRTMEHFQNAYPEHEFYFIIGADSLFSLESWRCPERLLRTCTILAAFRDGKDTSEMLSQMHYLSRKYEGSEIYLLNSPEWDVSSSEIRRCIKCKESIEGLVPPSVHAYIDEKELFREEEDGR